MTKQLTLEIPHRRCLPSKPIAGSCNQARRRHCIPIITLSYSNPQGSDIILFPADFFAILTQLPVAKKLRVKVGSPGYKLLRPMMS